MEINISRKVSFHTASEIFPNCPINSKPSQSRFPGEGFALDEKSIVIINITN
jgi:hypothetical protein